MSQKVYIAGPMSGLPEENRPAFFAMAERVKAVAPPNAIKGLMVSFAGDAVIKLPAMVPRFRI